MERENGVCIQMTFDISSQVLVVFLFVFSALICAGSAIFCCGNACKRMKCDQTCGTFVMATVLSCVFLIISLVGAVVSGYYAILPTFAASIEQSRVLDEKNALLTTFQRANYSGDLEVMQKIASKMAEQND